MQQCIEQAPPHPPALILEGPATESKILNSPAPPTLNIKAGGGGRECYIEKRVNWQMESHIILKQQIKKRKNIEVSIG